MKTKVLVLALFSLGVLAATTGAQTTSSKTITISGSGNQVVLVSGNLAASKGAAMALASTRSSFFVPGSGKIGLQPGQVLVLGSTGGATTAAAADTVVVSPRAALSPLSATVTQQVFPGDLVRGTPTATGLTDATGGFVMGPNGFPIAITPAAQTVPTTIGPNGFPTLGSPNAAPTIDTNGFPAGTGTAFAQTGVTAGTASTATTATSATSTATTIRVPATVGTVSTAPRAAASAATASGMTATAAPATAATSASPR